MPTHPFAASKVVIIDVGPRIYSGHFPLRFCPAAMAHASRAIARVDLPDQAGLAASPASTAHASLVGPRPGSTAQFIADCRELFKVRVTGMVVVTGWAGFYLGSMQSGISSLQRGLIDTLLG